MGEKDILERHLVSYNDVFADIVNTFFTIRGGGRPFRRILPEELQDTRARTLFKAAGEVHEQERDVIKLWKPGDTMFCLLGLENQTSIDPDMPLRVMSYEGGDYRRQLARQGVKPCPVLTIVLYFGTPLWTTNLTLSERLNVSAFYRPFLNDCHVNLFDLPRLTARQTAHFTSDFRFVAEYLAQMYRDRTYVPSKQLLVHVDAVLKLMSVLTGDRRFEETQNTIARGEAMTVESILGKIEERGIQIGKAQGLSEGLSQGLSEGLSRGLTQGLTQGEALMARRLAREMLTNRFGALSPGMTERLEQIQDVDLLHHLALNVYQTASLEDFAALLDAGKPQ